MAGIITLTTDFGLQDAYVGIMKGVILGISPQVQLVDLSHQIPPQDVVAGAFVLHNAYRFFPARTVHVVVVDPGVGSSRRPIVVDTSHGQFVGPDNGIFSLIYEKEFVNQIVEIQNPQLIMPKVSKTFHGRDIFAPVAAHLWQETPLDTFGPSVSDPVALDFWKIKTSETMIQGQIAYIDQFGNGIITLSREQIEEKGKEFRIEVAGRVFKQVYQIYEDAKKGEALLLYGSHDKLEISVNGGNAEKILGIRKGDEVRVIYERLEGI